MSVKIHRSHNNLQDVTADSVTIPAGVLVPIVPVATYAALTTKPIAIIYGTAAAPAAAGYPDGCIYVKHAA